MKKPAKLNKIPNQLTVARHDTPKGNLWFAEASWETGLISYGIDTDKTKARKLANTNKFTGNVGRPGWIYRVGESYLKGANIENNGKQPMLIVGDNSWIRNCVPSYLLHRYDIYLLFAPTTKNYWQLSCMAMDRQNIVKPLFAWAVGEDTSKVLSTALYSLLIYAKTGRSASAGTPLELKLQDKRNMWWMHWIYRCPKINLKDILHLAPYKNK